MMQKRNGEQFSLRRVMETRGKHGFWALRLLNIFLVISLTWTFWTSLNRSLNMIVSMHALLRRSFGLIASKPWWNLIRKMIFAKPLTECWKRRNLRHFQKCLLCGKFNHPYFGPSLVWLLWRWIRTGTSLSSPHWDLVRLTSVSWVKSQDGCKVFFEPLEGVVPSRGSLQVTYTAVTANEIGEEFSNFWSRMWLRDAREEQSSGDTWNAFDEMLTKSIFHLSLQSVFLFMTLHSGCTWFGHYRLLKLMDRVASRTMSLNLCRNAAFEILWGFSLPFLTWFWTWNDGGKDSVLVQDSCSAVYAPRTSLHYLEFFVKIVWEVRFHGDGQHLEGFLPLWHFWRVAGQRCQGTSLDSETCLWGSTSCQSWHWWILFGSHQSVQYTWQIRCWTNHVQTWHAMATCQFLDTQPR